VDRQYFRSVYFREPGGVLLEIATDPPGFTGDEDPEHLGERLPLPPYLEPHREQVERHLKPITTAGIAAASKVRIGRERIGIVSTDGPGAGSRRNAAGAERCELRFGISLPPMADAGAELRGLARLADEAGLDLLGIQDHPYAAQFFDTMSLISVVLADTGRLRVFPNVASLPLRPPAMLAKAAASLDVLSGGRFELGIGSGAVWPAIHAMGGPRRSVGEAIEALEEAISVIRAMWSPAPSARVHGEHYELRGVRPGPVPPHEIGIWIGSVGPRMLRLAGRLGDGWASPVPSYLPYEEWGRAQDLVDEGARRAGRYTADVVRIANVPGTIGGAGRGTALPLRGAPPIRGSSEHWAEVAAYFVRELRFDGLVFWPETPSAEQIERFAHEVVPVVRETLGAERQRA
jgi:alkanesulfonate monooxygenase SsuD/methylene tetrahydromethanopterin reductase-like flavin-dependent oxidoreductase (luciferase family)